MEFSIQLTEVSMRESLKIIVSKAMAILLGATVNSTKDFGRRIR